MKNQLVIFARTPRLGRGKRRLAAGIGDMAAHRFQRVTTQSLIGRLAQDRRWQTVLSTTPEGYRWPRGAARVDQVPGDLGRRMTAAFYALPAGPAALIGSDIPDIAPRHIARAFHILRGCDAVFGPTPDGGYWLVGLRDRTLLRCLFKGVRWSSNRTLADTLANLPPGRSHVLLDPMEDIDDAAAYRRWRGTD